MNIRRINSQAQYQRFYRIKDLHYFRHLLKHYDHGLVRDYFQSSLQVQQILSDIPFQFKHQQLVYISAEDVNVRCLNTNDVITLKQGYKVDESLLQIISEQHLTFYCLTKKTVLILQKLYFLNLPSVVGLRTTQKFRFFAKCQILDLNFNSFAYRKGEEIDAIYYIIEGQIKMMKDTGEKILQIVSLEREKLFGLFEIKNNCKVRQLYAKAGLNSTQILKIPLKLIQQMCVQKEQTMQAIMSKLKSQLFSITKTSEYVIKRQNILKQHINNQNLSYVKTVLMERKMKKFQSERNVKNKVLQNLVYSKRMLFKIKDLSDKIHSLNTSQQNTFEMDNVYAIKHFNDKWRSKKQKERIQKNSESNNLQRSNCKTQRKSRCFQGLMKYPTVQRYTAAKGDSSCIIQRKSCQRQRCSET